MINQEFEKYLKETGEVGYIVHSSNPIVYVSGLPSLRKGEAIVTEDGEYGMIFGMDKRKAEVLMFGTENIKGGKKVARTNELFRIPVSDNLLGRIINPLCLPVDNMGPISGEKKYFPIQSEAPGITQRAIVNQPMETGIMIIDLLIPLGYGQREMIIGDPKIGKTTVLLQTMSNQARKGTICIYVGIGKEISSLKSVEDYLKEMNVFDKVVMLITPSNQPSTLHYIAPFSGMTIAEYFRDKGNDVLIVFDDLSKHSKAYREISLLLKNPPGREAYPGDVFHLHAALVERAGNIKISEEKTASITAFPVAETLENDISGFIQTNLLSMTDGHIFFDINDLRIGRYPAINVFLSVSRVGNQTRQSLDKELAGKIKEKLVKYKKVMAVAQFGAELSKENQQILDFGKKIEILLNQDEKTIVSRSLQVLIFGLLFSEFWSEIPHKSMEIEIKKILKKFQEERFFGIEEKIKSIKTMEELRVFCKEIIPKIESFV